MNTDFVINVLEQKQVELLHALKDARSEFNGNEQRNAELKLELERMERLLKEVDTSIETLGK